MIENEKDDNTMSEIEVSERSDSQTELTDSEGNIVTTYYKMDEKLPKDGQNTDQGGQYT